MTKRLPLIFSLIVSVLALVPAYSQPAHAGEYMEALGEDYQAITKDAWGYVRAASRGRSARRIENRRQNLLNTIGEAKSRISRLPGWQGDPSFRDAVVNYLDINYKVLNDDYDKIIDLEEVAEQSYDLMEAYLLAQELAEKKMDEAFQALDQKQHAFADQYGITLVGSESRQAEKLRQATAANRYYNDLFLIFFKAYKQELYFMAALEEGDVSKLEQNRSALGAYAQEGLDLLDTIPRFNNDLTLKVACTEAMNFYKLEGGEASQSGVDFLLAKSEFEEIQELIENTSKNKRTQEMIDEYNSSVSAYNQVLQEYNSSMESLNRRRSVMLEKWESVRESFFERHMP